MNRDTQIPWFFRGDWLVFPSPPSPRPPSLVSIGIYVLAAVGQRVNLSHPDFFDYFLDITRHDESPRGADMLSVRPGMPNSQRLPVTLAALDFNLRGSNHQHSCSSMSSSVQGGAVT